MNFPKALLAVTVLGWIGVSLTIFQANGLLSRKVTWAWSPPFQSTTYFAWEKIPSRSLGYPLAILNPGQPTRFTVTLPRGFRAGSLLVNTATSTTLQINAEAKDKKIITARDHGFAHILNFFWIDLSAQGRRFNFILSNPAEEGPAEISSMSLTGTR